MQIHNVRLGKACNSSSTHSILLLQEGEEMPGSDPVQDEEHFGWDNFTLTTPEQKAKYLSALLHGGLAREFGADITALILETLGLNPNTDAAVDHQSAAGGFPSKYNTTEIDLEFLRDFVAFVLSDRAVILGGNDNSEGHPLSHSDLAGSVERYGLTAGKSTVCRRVDGVWTLFSRLTGSKIRVSFGDVEAPHSLSVPELVDMKITDYCPYGCAFCYMGSTPDGDHAHKSDIREILHELGKAKVFEVVFGGGEPTLHPDIADICFMARNEGMNVGITTKNYHWAFQNPNLYDAVAFSVDSIPGMNSLLEIHGKMGKDKRKLAAHVIDGVMDLTDTIAILKNLAKARIPTTILGFKETGRGSTFVKRYEHAPELVDIAVENPWTTRVDTAFIEQYRDEIDDRRVSTKSFTDTEGQTSSYIDMVTAAVGRSSYVAPKEMMALDEPHKYLDVYNRLRTEPVADVANALKAKFEDA